MQHRRLDDGDDAPTNVLVFDTGDDVTDGLLRFAREQDVSAAHFTAIGAFRRATLAFFNLETNEYEAIPVDEQAEVASLTGNLARYDGEPRLHAHAVLARRDGSTVGGHLQEAVVRPTLEVMMTVLPGATLRRTVDEATTLPLLQLTNGD